MTVDSFAGPFNIVGFKIIVMVLYGVLSNA
jgi:hypothetical protein